MYKISLKLCLMFLILSAYPVFAGIANADTIKRIRFAKGKTSATVRGSVLRDEVDTYIVGAGKGQRMTVIITSTEKNASFRIRNVSGEYVEGAGESDEPTTWNGTLAESGDYRIEVAPDRGNATYTLKVSITGSTGTSSQSSGSDFPVKIPGNISIHRAKGSTSEPIGNPALGMPRKVCINS